jgi:hypothetical protein
MYWSKYSFGRGNNLSQCKPRCSRTKPDAENAKTPSALRLDSFLGLGFETLTDAGFGLANGFAAWFAAYAAAFGGLTQAQLAAGNQSPLSPTGLPVYVPNVVVPARPRLVEAAGGSRTITLRWIANTEANLDHYRLYRTADAARDIRSMTLLTRIARDVTVPPAAGVVTPTAVAGVDRRWQIDDAVPPKKTHYYRLVAVDSNDHRSAPSELVNGSGLEPPPRRFPSMQRAGRRRRMASRFACNGRRRRASRCACSAGLRLSALAEHEYLAGRRRGHQRCARRGALSRAGSAPRNPQRNR